MKFLTGYYNRGSGKKKWNVLESVFILIVIVAAMSAAVPNFEVHRVLVGQREYQQEQIISLANIGIGGIFKVDLNTARANLECTQ